MSRRPAARSRVWTWLAANLAGANLQDADLQHARLAGANLLGANLDGAKLEWADLHQTKLDANTRIVTSGVWLMNSSARRRTNGTWPASI